MKLGKERLSQFSSGVYSNDTGTVIVHRKATEWQGVVYETEEWDAVSFQAKGDLNQVKADMAYFLINRELDLDAADDALN